MITCKKATEYASRAMDKTLPLYARVLLRFHLKVCAYCKRYEEQLRMLREAVRGQDAIAVEDNSESLSNDAKVRIGNAVRAEIIKD